MDRRKVSLPFIEPIEKPVEQRIERAFEPSRLLFASFVLTQRSVDPMFCL